MSRVVGGRVPGGHGHSARRRAEGSVQTIAEGCVAQGSRDQGLCSDADGSGVSWLLRRPEPFLTLSESSQSFFFLSFGPENIAIWINKVFCYC